MKDPADEDVVAAASRDRRRDSADGEREDDAGAVAEQEGDVEIRTREHAQGPEERDRQDERGGRGEAVEDERRDRRDASHEPRRLAGEEASPRGRRHSVYFGCHRLLLSPNRWKCQPDTSLKLLTPLG